MRHPPDSEILLEEDCPDCQFNARLLRGAGLSPQPRTTRDSLRLVDIFCGAGGISLGVSIAAARAGRALKIRLAVDSWRPAVDVYKSNFEADHFRTAPVEELFDAELGSRRLTRTERALRDSVGPVDLLVGGPPCQGYSDLNNHSRRQDPRNRLYARMARAAEVLAPKAIVIENVPAVIHDDEDVVAVTSSALEGAGYDVAGRVFDMSVLRLPQTRNRHLLLGVQRGLGRARTVLDAIAPSCPIHRPKTVRWAIGDLVELAPKDLFDQPSRSSPENLARIRWLMTHDAFDLPNRLRPSCHWGDHSYKAMYGRLRWDEPAQTITTGFGSMGQGRYVHPSASRTITPHEAARLQSFPDSFSFAAAPNRGALAQLIGNAVPPLFATTVTTSMLAALFPGSARRNARQPGRTSAPHA